MDTTGPDSEQPKALQTRLQGLAWKRPALSLAPRFGPAISEALCSALFMMRASALPWKVARIVTLV